METTYSISESSMNLKKFYDTYKNLKVMYFKACLIREIRVGKLH